MVDPAIELDAVHHQPPEGPRDVRDVRRHTSQARVVGQQGHRAGGRVVRQLVHREPGWNKSWVQVKQCGAPTRASAFVGLRLLPAGRPRRPRRRDYTSEPFT